MQRRNQLCESHKKYCLIWLNYIAGHGLGLGSYSCSWQLGLESECDSMQCENFCIVQCSHRVWNPSPSLYPSPCPPIERK